jgi:hypothetical protein
MRQLGQVRGQEEQVDGQQEPRPDPDQPQRFLPLMAGDV